MKTAPYARRDKEQGPGREIKETDRRLRASNSAVTRRLTLEPYSLS
jgi:hypothetical protein